MACFMAVAFFFTTTSTTIASVYHDYMRLLFRCRFSYYDFFRRRLPHNDPLFSPPAPATFVHHDNSRLLLLWLLIHDWLFYDLLLNDRLLDDLFLDDGSLDDAVLVHRGLDHSFFYNRLFDHLLDDFSFGAALFGLWLWRFFFLWAFDVLIDYDDLLWYHAWLVLRDAKDFLNFLTIISVGVHRLWTLLNVLLEWLRLSNHHRLLLHACVHLIWVLECHLGCLLGQLVLLLIHRCKLGSLLHLLVRHGRHRVELLVHNLRTWHLHWLLHRVHILVIVYFNNNNLKT